MHTSVPTLSAAASPSRPASEELRNAARPSVMEIAIDTLDPASQNQVAEAPLPWTDRVLKLLEHRF
jgi:hypothetical protein